MSSAVAHTDQYIIDGLKQNDHVIVSQVYKTYSPKIYNWVKQNSGTHIEAEDIFQEALIDIYTKAKTGNFVLTCPFDAFLFVIVRNKWLGQLKQNKKIQVTTDSDSLYNVSSGALQDAEAVLINEQQHQLLKEKLNQLQEGCKELLQLSWTGLNMEQVAQKLNMTYAYVRKKKSLCMAKLVNSIKENKHLITALQS